MPLVLVVHFKPSIEHDGKVPLFIAFVHLTGVLLCVLLCFQTQLAYNNVHQHIPTYTSVYQVCI